MRIAIVVDALPIPSETFILKEIQGLLDHGWDVEILVNWPASRSTTDPDFETYDLDSRIFQPPNWPSNRLKRGFLGFIYMTTAIKRSPRVLLNSLNVPRYGRHAASLRLMAQGMTFLDREPYDVIHSHFGPNGIRAMNLREIGAIQGKLATTFWGYDLSSFVRKEGIDCYQKLFREGDLFIAISEAMKNRLIELGCAETKIVVHPVGVDLAKFSRTSDGGQRGEMVHLLSVGRLVDKKGFADGISVLAELVHAGHNVTYTIVGSGHLQTELEALARDLHVSDRVDFVGWKSELELVEILDGVDILLAPSVTAADGDQEGTPVVILEAMAMKLPVISTRHSGIPEIVEDGVTGYLVAEGDIASMSARTLALVVSEDLRVQMGRAGRRKIEADFDLQILNRDLRELFRNLCYP